MKAWLLKNICNLDEERNPLCLENIPLPIPSQDEILIKILCCGVCHTELDEIEGRAAPSFFPVIPGHQVVGIIDRLGKNAKRFKLGTRVGVAWIFSACGKCEFCKRGYENLCPDFKGSGRDANGGYAEYMTVNENFAYAIPENIPDEEAAPLLCAGAIGYRSLKLAGIENGQVLGLTGFGASGHLVLKMVRHLFPETAIMVFARNPEEQKFALSLGAAWAGDSSDKPPQKANGIIDTTPVWKTVVNSLSHLKPGGRLVINAIRKESSDLGFLSEIDYEKHLWMEKEIKSVANITRNDVAEFLKIASGARLRPEIEIYPFSGANRALLDLKHRNVKGAKVLVW